MKPETYITLSTVGELRRQWHKVKFVSVWVNVWANRCGEFLECDLAEFKAKIIDMACDSDAINMMLYNDGHLYV